MIAWLAIIMPARHKLPRLATEMLVGSSQLSGWPDGQQMPLLQWQYTVCQAQQPATSTTSMSTIMYDMQPSR